MLCQKKKCLAKRMMWKKLDDLCELLLSGQELLLERINKGMDFP
jgi:hypothetical protein